MGKTVLMVMDLQRGIMERLEEPGKLLAETSKTLKAARDSGIPVIYITTSFRKGYPEHSQHNMTTERVKSMGNYTDGEEAVQVHPDVAPGPSDILVTKRRASAFGGSDLDVVLRGLEATRLVLTGVATSGVVLSTVRQAADLDYEITVLSDLCADLDSEVHRVLLEKVFPRQALVMTSNAWMNSLEI